MDSATTGKFTCRVFTKNTALSHVKEKLLGLTLNYRMYDGWGSMGPDKGLCCTLYQVENCNTDHWQKIDGFVWPGIPNYPKSYLLAINGMNTMGPVSIRCTVSGAQEPILEAED